jgi:hypothetical protein
MCMCRDCGDERGCHSWAGPLPGPATAAGTDDVFIPNAKDLCASCACGPALAMHLNGRWPREFLTREVPTYIHTYSYIHTYIHT